MFLLETIQQDVLMKIIENSFCTSPVSGDMLAVSIKGATAQ